MDNARVFVDLAKEVLAVDQLQIAPPKGLKVEATVGKFKTLTLCYDFDDVFFDVVACRREAFSYAISCARTGNDEVILVERKKIAVVEVDDILKCEEVAHHRVATEDCERITHRSSIPQAKRHIFF